MRRLLIFVLVLAIGHTPFATSLSFAKETDGDVPLTGISASLQPDPFTGILTGSIPIEIPPGRNGMQPNVVLAYESAGGNGWVGMGWKLEMGAIERQTRWGVLYQPTTQEELDGKVYTIRLDGVSTDLVQDAIDPLLYHEKIKGSFLRIKKLSADGTTGWEITDKKGTKYKFGTGTTTRIQGTVGSLGTQIFKWCLERVEDRDGNYMTMTFTGDQGQGYLSQIDYTGNGATAPTNQVKFYLEDRTDKPAMYISSFAITTAKRLKTIEVKASGVLVWAYAIQYSQSSTSSNSLLQNIQQFGKDAVLNGAGSISAGTSIPPTTFGYQGGPSGFQSPQNWGSATALGDPVDAFPRRSGTTGDLTRLVDMNGDGRLDYVAHYNYTTGQYGLWVLLNNGSGFNAPQNWGTATALSKSENGFPRWSGTSGDYTGLVDMNGDGRPDYVAHYNYTTGQYGLWVLLNNGSGFNAPQNWGTATALGDSVDAFPRRSGTSGDLTGLVDMNGDGRPDYVAHYNYTTGQYGLWVLLNNGSGFNAPQNWGTATALGQSENGFPRWSGTSGDYTGLVDMNGDGRPDYVAHYNYTTGQYGLWVLLNNGSGFNAPQNWGTATALSKSENAFPRWSGTSGDYTGLVDMNGDGRPDYVAHYNYTTGQYGLWVLLNNGSGFNAPQNWGTATALSKSENGFPRWSGTSGDYTGLVDMNDDGRPDYVAHYNYTTGQYGLWVLLNNGSGFNAPQNWGTATALSKSENGFPRWSGTSGDYTGLADMNGDGQPDYVAHYNYTTSQYGLWVLPNTIMAPDLLTKVANGLGGSTTIQYQSSTTYTNTQLSYPVQTVSVLTTCDNWNSTTSICAGNASTTTYSYSGGYHHIGEREFRGFKTVAVTSPGATDADKTVTTTWFHQGNEVNPVDTEDPGLANGYMKGQPYRVEVRRKSDSLLYAKTETTYHTDRIGADTTAPWFTPPAQVDSSVCEGGPCKSTRVTFAAADYDAYGNLQKESHHGDLAVTGDEKTVERAFVLNTTDYLVSLPIRESHYKGLSVASADKLAETLFYYDGTGTGTCTATPTGSQTTVTKGKLTKTERWLKDGTNPVSGMEYDSTTGVLLCSRDPLGNKTTLTYDPTKTFLLTATNQLGHVTTTVYYGVNGEAIPTSTGFYGAVKSVTDPNSKVLSHEYDALGRRTKTTAPDGLITTMTYPTLAEFGVIGTQKLSTSTSGASLPAALTSSTFFDGLGRTFKKETSGPNGTTLVTETQYDVKGQAFRTSLPYFKTTESVTNRWRTMTYDALGRVTQVTHPDTLGGTPLTSKTCYAPFVTVTVDASGSRKREVKDAYGRVVTIQEHNALYTTCTPADDPGGVYATTTYTYDLLGNLTKVVDALGNRTTMRYDTLGRKLAMSDPDMSTNGTTTCADLTAVNPNATYPWYAAPCWNYQYDASGNLTRQTDAKDQHLWFRYDGLNRRTQKDFTTQKAQGSGDVVYVYDDSVTTFNRKGRLKQVTDVATNVTFEYDAMGRISKSTKVMDGTTYVTTSGYDGLGRLKEVTYPTATPKTVEYLYTGPALEKVQDKAGSGTTIYAAYSNYTSQGQAQTITYGNGVVTTHTYADPAHPTCVPANTFKLCTLKTQKGTNPVLQDLTYTFTAEGNVDLIQDPLNGNQAFGYDLQDRLTSASGPYGAGGVPATLTYNYNQIGNMLTNSQVGTYTYPTSGAGVVRPHAVTAAGSNTYTYDKNGNMLTGAGRTYTWNLENKPLTTVQGGTTTTFVYDGDGGRVKKIVGSTTTRYISKIYECDNANCTRFIWAGSTRIATIAVTSGTIHYWHGDHLGSSSVVTDSTGAKVQTVAYYPYGGTRANQSFSTPAVDVPYKYTGKELDNTGLYYYEARYYDPTLGRFISPDTIVPNQYDPQSLNRYAYVRNNPLRYTDPTGHFFDDIVDFFEGIGENILRPFNEGIKIAKDIWHKPLRLISPIYYYGEIPYRAIASDPLLRAAGLGEELDAGLRGLQKFRDSSTGRYIDAGVIVAGSAIATFYCGGCGTLATLPYLGTITTQAVFLGAAIGSASGLAQAAFTGGDPFQAAALGGLMGAAGAAIGGGVTSTLKTAFSANSALLGGVDSSLSIVLSKGVAPVVGSVVGSSIGEGLKAAAVGKNIGKGFGLGAVGGAFGGAMGVTFGGDLMKVYGEAGGYVERGIRGVTRQTIDGAFDWTGGWFAEQTQ